MEKGEEQRVVKWFKDWGQWMEEVEISKKITEKVGQDSNQYFVLVEWSGKSEELAKLPNFLPITRVYHYFTVSTYEPLGDLITYLISNGKMMTYSDRFWLSLSAVECMARLHAANIAHCDIKLDNMVVVKNN